MTSYVILARNNDGFWIEGPTLEAASGEAAIRASLERDGGPGKPQAYVAVPARSWKPVRVSVETVKKVRLDDVAEPQIVESPA